MLEAACFELPYDFGRFPGRLFDNRAFDRGEIKRTAAQHNHRFVAVKGQVSELQHNLESPAADHDYIDAGKEFLEPVRLLLTCIQEVERVVRASQKAIDAPQNTESFMAASCVDVKILCQLLVGKPVRSY